MTSSPACARTPPRTPRCCRSTRRRRPRPASTAFATATHPTVLERAVGFWPSTLRYRFAPRWPAEPLGVHERRRALAEGQHRVIGDRQEPSVPLHESRPGDRAGRHRVSHRRDRASRRRRPAGSPRTPPSPRPGSRLRSGSPCRPRTRPLRPRRARPGAAPAGRPAGRRTSDAGHRTGPPPRPRAGRLRQPAQVDPRPRATATRSPSTALLVAGPPAPGPARPTVPSGSASISIRFVTPSVQPKGPRPGRRSAPRRPRSRRRGA